jgi:hypothetical protein
VAYEIGYFNAIMDDMDSSTGEDIDGIAPSERIMIAYIEPSDRAQSLNLMLAETVSAAVYGDAQLHECLWTLVNSNEMELAAGSLSDWAPDKIILHEREPVGLDFEKAISDSTELRRQAMVATDRKPDVSEPGGVPTHSSEESR